MILLGANKLEILNETYKGIAMINKLLFFFLTLFSIHTTSAQVLCSGSFSRKGTAAEIELLQAASDLTPVGFATMLQTGQTFDVTARGTLNLIEKQTASDSTTRLNLQIYINFLRLNAGHLFKRISSGGRYLVLENFRLYNEDGLAIVLSRGESFNIDQATYLIKSNTIRY